MEAAVTSHSKSGQPTNQEHASQTSFQGSRERQQLRTYDKELLWICELIRHSLRYPIFPGPWLEQELSAVQIP